jgi:hypothetical protein
MSGQQWSLMSPGAEYPQVSLVHLRALIAARSSKLAMRSGQIESGREQADPATQGTPPPAFPMSASVGRSVRHARTECRSRAC